MQSSDGVTAHSVSISGHTMHAFLPAYIRSRIHPEIENRRWSKIIVRGHYRRTGDAQVSPTEKRDKPFNWQRPTAIRVDDSTLELACFPGRDYVKHYAAITATYLSLSGCESTTVQYILPSKAECMAPLLDSNLSKMGKVDVVVVGYVHHFDRTLKGSWEKGDSEDDQIFAWQKSNTADGRTFSFLGCNVSFWGDISGRLVHALQRLNHVKSVLYVGKAGSLRKEDRPNCVIATGDRGYIDGELITWKNVLATEADNSPTVVKGTHVTVFSPLEESSAWFEKWKDLSDWVDCEVGYMAQASNQGGTSFGYLHIISDNLATSYPYNLSNERLEEVVQNRKRLFKEIDVALDKFLAKTH